MTETLVAALLRRAADDGDAAPYVFLDDRGGRATLTFAELDARARALGGALVDAGAAGERVLLPLDMPQDYVVGYFAALYAGALPVSAAALVPVRLAGTAEHLARLAEETRAVLALGTARGIELGARAAQRQPGLADLRWVDVAAEGRLDRPAPEATEDPRAPAYLQHTSGSTGAPKAVVLTHANFTSNAEVLSRAYDVSPQATVVSWLPTSHDMGFVAPIVLPLLHGCRAVFMTPTAFVLKPVRWLQAITEFGGTLAGGPNFAYEALVRRVAPADREGLDLTTWRHAVNAAEPVRAETLRRFTEAYAPVGFRPETFAPTFGMSEMTCLATASPISRRPVVRRFDRTELGRRRAVPVAEGADGLELVGCGGPHELLDVRIVDERTLEPVPDGEIGELWLSGPSVGDGYFGRPEESEATMRANLAGTSSPGYLRTGDLAVLHEGEVFITGRLKDLIIVRGRNFAPPDVEETVAAAHPGLAPDGGAAIAVDGDGGEELGIVHEVADVREADPGEITEAIQAALARTYGIKARTVVLLEPGGLPKTTSGKVRRQASREALREGELRRVLTVDGAAPSAAPS